MAEEIKRRFGCDLVRFSNSGTEATMDAIRVARGYTGREKIIKFEGGYHGHHDDVLISIQPPRELIGHLDAPCTVPASAGLPALASTKRSSRRTTTPTRWRRSSSATGARSPRSSIEPVQFNIGVVPPLPGFLERVRELATAHGAVLIFDEVKTGVVIAYGGANEWFGVKPDLFCLAKSIGGGVPVGAFGGRGEIMGVIEKLPERTARRRRRHRPRAHDHPRRRDTRRPPGHVQRQPAGHGRGRHGADADPDARRHTRA